MSNNLLPFWASIERNPRPGLAGAILLSLLAAGCGGTSQGSSPPATSTAAPAARAAGDIPDTATYITYHGPGYKVQYVEGWTIQTSPGSAVSISDKDSSETVTVVKSGSQSAAAYATHDLAQLQTTAPKFHLVSKHTVSLASGSVPYVQYRTLSAPDPVTSKQVSVIVDRYYVPGSGKIGVLTLVTPLGVDNIDAFRREAKSFRWA